MVNLILTLISIALVAALVTVTVNYVPWHIKPAADIAASVRDSLVKVDSAYQALARANEGAAPAPVVGAGDGGFHALLVQDLLRFTPAAPPAYSWSYHVHNEVGSVYTGLHYVCLAAPGVKSDKALEVGLSRAKATFSSEQVTLSETCGSTTSTTAFVDAPVLTMFLTPSPEFFALMPTSMLRALIPVLAAMSVLCAPASAVAQSGAAQASSSAVDSISGKLVRAMDARMQAYAKWQAANPLAPASSATFEAGLATWATYAGLHWVTGGTEDLASLCFTVPVADGVTREAVVLAAGKQGAQLVDANCNSTVGQTALQAPVLGLKREISRAQVLVKPVGTLSRLNVSRTGVSTVTLSNQNPVENLLVRGIRVSLPFSATHDCTEQLPPLGTCQLQVTLPGSTKTLEIGRLHLQVGQSTDFVVPLRSVRTSTPSSLSLIAVD